DNDLKKIIAHSGNAPEISKEDVLSTIEISPEHDVFAMIEAIGSNKKNEAYRYLNNLLADKGNVFQLLSLITKQLEIMLTTCEMKDQGMTLKAIQTALKKSEKIHEYRTKKAYEAGNRFRKETLKQMLLSAYEVEYNIKSGLMPERLALEFFISSI
ncbi:MAG: hypothetical protein Q4B78_00190, partial [Bacillota bacterium]|nr:hypothetical protein [Bacillota bacterium]